MAAQSERLGIPSVLGKFPLVLIHATRSKLLLNYRMFLMEVKICQYYDFCKHWKLPEYQVQIADGPFQLRKPGLHLPQGHLHQSKLQQPGGLPVPLPALGSHTPAICSLSHHTDTHPPVVYGLGSFSLQLLLLLDQVVITVNCSSVFLPSVRSLSSPFSLWKGRQGFVLFFKNTWCHFLFLKSRPDDQNNARVLYMALNFFFLIFLRRLDSVW